MQTVADMRGVGVKNRGKLADVLCGRPLTSSYGLSPFLCSRIRKSSIGLVISNSMFKVKGLASCKLTLESGAALMTGYR